MKPVLFPSTATTYETQGLGTLDCVSCVVTEERNGVFELEMQISKDAAHYEDCVEGNIIVAIHDDRKQRQAFQIYKRSKAINGIVTLNAEHISYRLSKMVTMPFKSTNVVDALQKLKDNAVETCPFEFWTDKKSNGAFELTAPASIRSQLGGEEGSILDVFGGGEYEWDNFTVKLYQHRGTDTGITLRKGKNITDYTKNVDASGVYTAIVPYATNGDEIITLPEKIVRLDGAPEGFTTAVDLSDKFEETPTEAELRAAARAYVETNAYAEAKTSSRVSFVALWQTEEYKNVAPLQRVRLCDTVNVVYDAGDLVQTRVVKTVYNVLLERYDEIQLGEAFSNMSAAVKSITDVVKEGTVTKSQMQTALERAADLISGGLGGYVIFNRNADGEPQEILIMDTDDKETAVNVIRINSAGIAFSKNGYNGPFVSAWTIDGRFVADFITTGTLDGALIRAGSIEANMLSVAAKEEFNVLYEWIPDDALTNPDLWYTPYSTQLTKTVTTYNGKSGILLGRGDTAYGSGQFVLPLPLTDKGDVRYIITICPIQDYTSTTNSALFYVMYKYNGTPNIAAFFNMRENATYKAGEEIRIAITRNKAYESTEEYIPDTVPDSWLAINFTVPLGMGGLFVSEMSVITDMKMFSKSLFTVTADGLSSVVTKGDVISAINQSAESIDISADKIGFSGTNINMTTGSLRVESETGYGLLSGAQLALYDKSYTGTVINRSFFAAPIYYPEAAAGRYSLCGSILLNAYDFRSGKKIYLNPCSSQMDGIFYFSENVYNTSGGVAFTSDARKKNSIEDLDTEKAKKFIRDLRPRMFKYNEGTSNRYHHGFIAQELCDAMDDDDWGVFVIDSNGDQSIRPTEIIADLVAVVQEQEKRIAALEERL